MIPRLALGSLFRKDVHFENAIYLGNKHLRSLINKKDKGLLGSHFSMAKSDLLDVNGFDERFSEPAAGEDTDLEMRLRRNGVRVRTLKHIAIQYHLWHRSLPRVPGRLEILEENNKGGVTYTPFGMVKKS
jgi:GT2 family glycosyltransferase